jgi:two-component system nitrogen regulation sensor histidine kinase NtrY
MPKSNPRLDDLNDVVSETTAIYREAHSEIAFNISLDATLPLFALDREQLNRVLINLIDNSVSSILSAHSASAARSPLRSVNSRVDTESAFSKEIILGTIEISTLFDPGLNMATLCVSDSGLGIPDDDKPRLFEPYFSTKGAGTGLGLTIVSAIIADHNGFIRVRDKMPRGASFIIELPVAKAVEHRQAVA